MPLLKELNTPVNTVESAIQLSAVINGVVHYYLDTIPDKSTISAEIQGILKNISVHFVTVRVQLCLAMVDGFKEKLAEIESNLSALGCVVEKTMRADLMLRLERLEEKCRRIDESDFENDPLKVQRVLLSLTLLAKDYFQILKQDPVLAAFQQEIKNNKSAFAVFLKRDLQKTAMADNFDPLREAIGDLEDKINKTVKIGGILICYRALLELIEKDRDVDLHILSTEDIRIIKDLVDKHLKDSLKVEINADYESFLEQLKNIKSADTLSLGNLIPLLNGQYLTALASLLYNHFYNADNLMTLDAFAATAKIQIQVNDIILKAQTKAKQHGNDSRFNDLQRYLDQCYYYTRRNMMVMLPITASLKPDGLLKLNQNNPQVIHASRIVESVIVFQANRNFILQSRRDMREFCDTLQQLLNTPDNNFLGISFRSSPKPAYAAIKALFERMIGNSDETQYVKINNELQKIISGHGLEKRVKGLPQLNNILNYYEKEAAKRCSPPIPSI